MDLSRLVDANEGEEHAGATALLSLSPTASTSSQAPLTNPAGEPDCLAGQLVKTHFGGSGKHYEPIKPWQDTLAALRAGEDPSTALHRTIAHNTSYLRSYFAKVDACPEEHDPFPDCM
jgi:hypothetical protein